MPTRTLNRQELTNEHEYEQCDVRFDITNAIELKPSLRLTACASVSFVGSLRDAILFSAPSDGRTLDVPGSHHQLSTHNIVAYYKYVRICVAKKCTWKCIIGLALKCPARAKLVSAYLHVANVSYHTCDLLASKWVRRTEKRGNYFASKWSCWGM